MQLCCDVTSKASQAALNKLGFCMNMLGSSFAPLSFTFMPAECIYRATKAAMSRVISCFRAARRIAPCARSSGDCVNTRLSRATAWNVSRQHHVCIAYWPAWNVIPPSMCLQHHVLELPSKAGAVADGPVLGVLMLVMLPKQGHTSALSCQ